LVVVYFERDGQWNVISGATCHIHDTTGYVGYLATSQSKAAKALYPSFDDQPWEGRGLATLLLAALGAFGSVRSLELGCNKTNERAWSFYKKRGFRECNEPFSNGWHSLADGCCWLVWEVQSVEAESYTIACSEDEMQAERTSASQDTASKKESYTHSETRLGITYSKADMQAATPTEGMVDFNNRVAEIHTGKPLSELVYVSPPTPMRAKAAALNARFLDGKSFERDGDGIRWVKAGKRGNELHISTKFCCGFEGYGNVHELNKRPKQQRNHTLRLRNYEGSHTDPGYLWPEMVAKRDALAAQGFGIGLPGFDLDAFAEERLGAAFVIAYVYMIEQMRDEITAIRGSCGRLADSHDVDTFNKSSAFGWHPDNHTQEDVPPGPYVEHSAVCQCSPGETSMTVAGLPESVYLGVGSIVIFPAWALHRTSKRGEGPSMWKLAGFFEP